MYHRYNFYFTFLTLSCWQRDKRKHINKRRDSPWLSWYAESTWILKRAMKDRETVERLLTLFTNTYTLTIQYTGREIIFIEDFILDLAFHGWLSYGIRGNRILLDIHSRARFQRNLSIEWSVRASESYRWK